MNRRIFLEKTAILGTTALLPLSSFNEDMTKNTIGTLKSLKAMGYEDFETYGFDSEKGTYYGYKASEFKTILEDLQITASSGHYGFNTYLDKPTDDLNRFVDQCIKGALTLNMKYITWPWIAPEQRTIDNFKLMSTKLNIIGEQVSKAGLGFAYHNHDFEFTDHDGENGYDIILNETDASLVKLQMDLYWVMHSSKLSPKELIAKQPGRYVMWHIKDMDKVTRDYTELGKGSINYAEILPDPIESGLKFYYLEQGGNFKINAMKSAASNAGYFKKHLQQYL